MKNAKSKGEPRISLVGGLWRMVNEEEIIRFLREIGGEATLEEISSALKIPKYGPNSDYLMLYTLKSKNIIERRGLCAS